MKSDQTTEGYEPDGLTPNEIAAAEALWPIIKAWTEESDLGIPEFDEITCYSELCQYMVRQIVDQLDRGSAT